MSMVVNVARTISRPASLKALHTASNGFPKTCSRNICVRNSDLQQSTRKGTSASYKHSLRGDSPLHAFSTSSTSSLSLSSSSSSTTSSPSSSPSSKPSQEYLDKIAEYHPGEFSLNEDSHEDGDDEISELEGDLFEIRQCDLLEKGFYTLSCSESQQSFAGGQSACTAIGVSMSRKFLSKADFFSTLWFNNSSIFEKIIKTGVKWQRLWASHEAVDVCTKPSAYSLCEIEPISRKVQVNHEVCYGGSSLDQPDWGSNISDALQRIFGNEQASSVGAFLLTVAEYTTFVGKKDSRIVWFDSHLRDKDGLQDGNGSAVWMQFYGWEYLRDHIIKLYDRHQDANWELVEINRIR